MTDKVCVFGSFNVDIVAKVAHFPQPGETLMARSTTLGPGGKGANQALAAHLAGAQVHFATKVGRDQFQSFARHHFDASGLNSFSLYETDQAPTGSAVIYVNDDGENMIAINPGANQLITADEIQELAPYLAEAKVLLLQLENNFDAIEAMIQLATKLGMTTILNPAPYAQELNRFIQLVDIITPNETEASQISGIQVHDLDSAKQAASHIHQQGPDKVIITLGQQGSLLFDGNAYTHIPAYHAIAVDTTGAGDAFNGALAASLAKGLPLSEAVLYASAFASLAVERTGAANMPGETLVNSRMQQQSIEVTRLK